MGRKLHIGGECRKEGWEVLNIFPGPEVDHCCNANDLSIFEDNTFEEIYASHIVEHLDYSGELFATLKEWLRVLAPGGRIYISTPDMDTLCQIILEKQNSQQKHRYMAMRMLFGGHADEHDYHVVGLNEEFLSAFLKQTGYVNIRRVESFDIFDDTSTMTLNKIPISLNLIAEKSA